MTVRLIALLGAWLALAAAASPSPAASGEPARRLKPVHVVTLPPSGSSAVAISADGRSLYHAMDVHHVNAWALLAYRWPEAVGVVGLVGGAAWGVRRWRGVRRSRQRVPGEPYCRGCGYRLSGLTADRCPECGRGVSAGRNRVIAKPPPTAGRRVLVSAAVAAALCLLAFYPVRFALGRAVYRPHPTAGRFHWNSRALHSAAKAFDLKWILRHGEQVQVIVERSLAEGQLVQEFKGHCAARSMDTLRLSPDGSTLWVADVRCLRSWDVRAGKPSRVLPCPEDGSDWSHSHFWIGPDAALAQCWNAVNGPVAAWNLKTGQPEKIPPELEIRERLKGVLPDAVHVLLEQPPRVDNFGHMDLFNRRTGETVPPYVIRVPLDIDSPSFSVYSPISRDGKRIFPRNSHRGRRGAWKGPSIQGWNLETGDPLPWVGLFPGRKGTSIQAEPIGDGRRLLAWHEDARSNKPKGLLEIWDVDKPRRVARLDTAPNAARFVEPLTRMLHRCRRMNGRRRRVRR